METSNFFEKYGLEVMQGSIEVGKTYPIFGMITKIDKEGPGDVVVEINFNIKATMNISDEKRLGLLRERAFESGIFVSTVTKMEPSIEVDCQKVIFGKKQGFNA